MTNHHYNMKDSGVWQWNTSHIQWQKSTMTYPLELAYTNETGKQDMDNDGVKSHITSVTRNTTLDFSFPKSCINWQWWEAVNVTINRSFSWSIFAENCACHVEETGQTMQISRSPAAVATREPRWSHGLCGCSNLFTWDMKSKTFHDEHVPLTQAGRPRRYYLSAFYLESHTKVKQIPQQNINKCCE